MNYICPEELEAVMLNRDRGMFRVNVATEVRKKQLNANNLDEYYSIPIPRIFSVSVGIFEERSESREMYDNISGFIDMYCRGYNMLDQNGCCVCRYGNLGSVVLSDLFRGENRIYPSASTSSLGRICRGISKCSKKDAYIEFVIAQMRMYLFFGFLTQFRQFREFPFGTPMPHLIAQHYGLPTQFLDLTDDIKVALFFACCKYDNKNHRYLPISENDIGEYGEDAVLYCGIEDHDSTSIIGYQPFTRCFRQRGYYIDTAQQSFCWNYSLQNNNGFSKNLFKRTPELCRRIYNEFDGGDVLFPQDSLFEFEEDIERIRKTAVFPSNVFEAIVGCAAAYLHPNSFIPVNEGGLKDWLYNELLNHGVTFSEKYCLMAKHNSIKRCNDSWSIEKYKNDNDIIAWGREVIPLENGAFALSSSIKGYGIFSDVAVDPVPEPMDFIQIPCD